MTPTTRKIVYALSFETIGIAVSTLGLLLLSDASPTDSLVVSAFASTIAMTWSFIFNLIFEAREARQTTKGRSLSRRAVHALGFAGGLVLLMLPLMAWWLDVSLLQALVYESGLIAIFIAYTYVFTWAFDRIFGLPASARPH